MSPEQPRGDNPIDALASTLDALDRHLHRADVVIKRSESNRLSLLHIHAAAALVIAPLFWSIGSAGMTGPSWVVLRAIPGMPGSLAVVLAVGGLVLAVSTTLRHKRVEIVGLAMLLAWYLTIAVGFGAASVVWVAGSNSPAQRPSFYAAAVYTHLAVIMAVHIRTLRRMSRRRR
ncbi:hypothetical protein [Micromonospora sp. NPDC005652]|uniref:hypothetical protein n=1 Tax=Micromonospora sp. NPDC005652 TaxID=3157046 RepID=UPI0033D4AE11